jgi:hypothetical protein
MAKTDSIFFQKAFGHVGRQFVFKQYGGRTLIAKYPDMSKRVLSEKQLRNNRIMEEACYAAREIMADEEQRSAAQVRLNVTSNRLYPSLIREYFAKERGKAAEIGSANTDATLRSK